MYVNRLDEHAPIINKSLIEISLSHNTDKFRAVAIKEMKNHYPARTRAFSTRGSLIYRFNKRRN